MTIRLLSTYDGFAPQSIITLDSALETALIAGGNATATLTGGVVAYQDRTPLMVQNGPKRSGTARVNANRRMVVPLDEGMALIITGDTGVVGTAQRYDAAGAAAGGAIALTAGAMTAIGPYQGNQTVEIKANAKGASVLVQDGVLSVSAGGGGGGVSSVSASTPLAVSGPTATPTISLPAATTAQPGHMTTTQVAALGAALSAVPIATASVLGGIKQGRNIVVDSAGVASAVRPSALSTAADKISDKAAWGRKKRLLTTATGVAGVPNAGAATVYWPWVIRATDRIASPIDKFYMYYSTDHDAGAGGIWLATAPTPEGPWTVYGLVYVDAGGGQSETPSVVWDRENSRYCMMYQIQAAVTNGAAARGVQSTVAAYSTNGLNWTKDPNFIIDIPFANTQVGDGHTGYFLPFETRRGLFAYSLYGGTNSYGSVLWKSNGDLSGQVINAANGTYGTGWHSDRKHLGYGLDMTIPVAALGVSQYINWHGGFVVEAQGTEYWVGIISNLVSGADASVRVLAAAPVSANYRALTEAPRIVWTPDQAWESADLRSATPFVDDGRLYIYYAVKQTEIGVISYAL